MPNDAFGGLSNSPFDRQFDRQTIKLYCLSVELIAERAVGQTTERAIRLQMLNTSLPAVSGDLNLSLPTATMSIRCAL